MDLFKDMFHCTSL